MATLKDNFQAFLSRIEPSEERAESAQDMPHKVRHYLHKHEELKTVDPHTRLGGSYGRQTAIGEIKDVDVLLFVAEEYEDDIESLLKLVRKVLKDLPNELADCGEVKLRPQRRSVNVILEKHDLSLDVVPVRLTTEKTSDILLVPDREWDDWVETQPLGYAQLLTDLNKDNIGKIVPLVKMFKHWKDAHFQRKRPKSYWLESLVVRHIHKEFVITEGKGYGEIVANLFDSIYEAFKPEFDTVNEVPEINDNMLQNNVAFNWERDHFERFMNVLDDCRKWARRALDADEDKAIELWQRVFGEEFPDNECTEALLQGPELGLGSTQGTNKITATGKVLLGSAVATVATTVAPAKRFYGE